MPKVVRELRDQARYSSAAIAGTAITGFILGTRESCILSKTASKKRLRLERDEMNGVVGEDLRTRKSSGNAKQRNPGRESVSDGRLASLLSGVAMSSRNGSRICRLQKC